MSTVPTGRRPASVTWSFVLWLITAILGIIGGIIIFVLAGALSVRASSSTGSALPIAFFFVGGVIAIVIAIIELLIVFRMRAGRNWARIVLLIVAILQVIGNLTQVNQNNISNWIGLVTVVIATVLMFVPTSNDYFRANSGRAARGQVPPQSQPPVS